MSGDPRPDLSAHDRGKERVRLSPVEPSVQAEYDRILDEARQQAAEIVRQAEAEADRLRSVQQSRDRELLAAIGERIVSMGDAYREAMIGARKAVEQMAELALRSTATSLVPPAGPPAAAPAGPPAAAPPGSPDESAAGT
jgi:vacuolar-type H+-ATPase subunit H